MRLIKELLLCVWMRKDIVYAKKLYILLIIGAVLFGISLLFVEPTMSDNQENTKKAIFAGGCFWCMEGPFEKLDGVSAVISGYTGGTEDNPTYEQVARGQTSHAEAVEVTYDPSKLSYDQLLDVFWMSINPTQKDGQFADIGKQYRTGIFYIDEEQKQLAEASKAKFEAKNVFDGPIVTEITEATEFFPAEEYHQDYYKKNPTHYKMYRYGSGREPYLKKLWGDQK